ncbi:SDR family oxidoreductase [Halobacteriovorax sp. GB3]|uniref:SDR family oxidoreductase n=1 Tax=Halobacteriovorax sp. GB3 TaxID=2719615 RepID=UPI002361FA0C|nr:SDR family oxidoreductase [Halobacteriovorax sp. GB3]MDD0851877.1 SDR family oxidoreductase [Halobacteriovorax sp. GB3]
MANVVITGANRGIGLELTKIFTKRGDSVVALCREASSALRETGAKIIENFDVTNQESIDSLSEKIDGVDLLINNAGIFLNETIQALDFDSIEKQFQVNTLAPLKITMALIKNLNQGSKVCFVSSRMGSISDNTSGSYYGYRMSKAGLNAFGKSLAMDLKGQGIAVALLHPGYVQTKMTGFNGEISPTEAAEGLSKRIDELTLENSGGFWHSNGEQLPW